MKQTLLIGVAGGTGSGKTSVAKRLPENLDEKRVVIIPQDAYYRDRSHLPAEEREKINFDHPDAIDDTLLLNHLEMLSDGKGIDRPVYSFVTHERLSESVSVRPCDVVILEGILVLSFPKIREMLDIRIFIDTPDDIRLIRRLKRDMRERGRSLESVVEQYMDTVRPMHEQFVEPSKRYADLLIPEGGHNRVAIDLVASKIAQVLENKKQGNADS